VARRTIHPAAEIGILAGVVVAHVADHRVVPRRFHLATHLATAAAAVAGGLAAGLEPDELGLDVTRLPSGLGHGVVSAFTSSAVVGVGVALPATRELFVDERVVDATPGDVALRTLVEIPLGTALYEELVFRGVVQALATRRLGVVGGAAVTSALFGLWHVLPSLADREHNPATRHQHPLGVVAGTVLSTTVAGALFATQRIRSGSIVAPVVAHAGNNAVIFAVAAAVTRRATGAWPPTADADEVGSGKGP
jgi:membrane protease YdiL (CAAX protease family)